MALAYLGGKFYLRNKIMPIILKDRKPEQWYVEPFLGGANTFVKAENPKIGSDINPYLIALLDHIGNHRYLECLEEYNLIVTSFEDYKFIKNNFQNYAKHYLGWVGFSSSFGGKFFDSYDNKTGNPPSKRRPYKRAQSVFNSLKSDLKGLLGGKFINCSYDKLKLPPNSLIYCDPPYKNTTGYGENFDHNQFWSWCRIQFNKGHKIFVSELEAPEDFECVYIKNHKSTINKNNKKIQIEKLFTLR